MSNIDDKEWRIWVKQSFSPSGSNNGRIFLCSDNSDLSNASNGYFIQLGEAGSNDAIRLFKLDNNVSSEICSGSNAQIATSFDISLKIIRNTNGDWSVYADLSGGQNYSFLCSSNDGSNLFGSFSLNFSDEYEADDYREENEIVEMAIGRKIGTENCLRQRIRERTSTNILEQL